MSTKKGLSDKPTSELEKDLSDSIEDIALCEESLRLEAFDGIINREYVIERMATNQVIILLINAELERRQAGHGQTKEHNTQH